jgi:hypothetical protein
MQPPIDTSLVSARATDRTPPPDRPPEMVKESV